MKWHLACTRTLLFDHNKQNRHTHTHRQIGYYNPSLTTNDIVRHAHHHQVNPQHLVLFGVKRELEGCYDNKCDHNR